MLTHNLLELLKAVALEPVLRQARPKRVRFMVFAPCGRVVDHARLRLMRVASAALQRLLAPALGRVRRGRFAPG